MPAVKLEELTNAMESITGTYWGSLEKIYKEYLLIGLFQWRRDRHEYGVVFLVHRDMVSAVLECRPVSSRVILVRLRAALFNITILQIYAIAYGHDDNEVDPFYQQLQKTIDQTPKKDILVLQGDWKSR